MEQSLQFSSGVLVQAGSDISRWSSMYLRHLDWRFLLPNFHDDVIERLMILGDRHNVGPCVTDIALARSVITEPVQGDVADAVVRLHTASETLIDAAKRVRDGGVFYGEVDPVSQEDSWNVASRLRKTLAEVGLHSVRFYWVTPGFDNHQAYVPLASETAVRWYLSNFYKRRNPFRVVMSVLRPFGENAVAPLVPRLAVTAVSNSRRSGLPGMAQHPMLPSDMRDSVDDVLVYAPGNRRIILLPFSKTSEWPLAALKLTRNVSRNARSKNEQEVLSVLHASCGSDLRQSLPIPLGALDWKGLVVSAETGVAGRPLVMTRTGLSSPNSRSVRHLRQVAHWLRGLHVQTNVETVRWGASDGARTLEDVLSQFEDSFGTLMPTQELFERVIRRSAELDECSIPIVWTHGDLQGGNIYAAKERLSVIDWVSGRPGLPLFDLFRFSLEWSAHVNRCWTPTAKRHNFTRTYARPDMSRPLVRAIQEELRTTCDVIGLDRSFIPVLLTLHWVELSVRHVRRARRTGSQVYLDMATAFAGYVDELCRVSEPLFSHEEATAIN
jgi:hypothetical protein